MLINLILQVLRLNLNLNLLEITSILQDVGGSIPANVVLKDTNQFSVDYSTIWSTNVSECMKLHLTDILEFLTDFHTLAKIKVSRIEISVAVIK